jgi:tripartite-type tricarboxylate transporter receptor subunit TctC
MMNSRTARQLAALLLIGGAVLVATVPAALAQPYPSKLVKMLIGYPAGSGTDLYGRAIAKHLQNSLGWRVIIENKIGAAGNIAVESAVRAPADGYTILLSASQIVINPFVRKLSYDIEKDLIPVLQTTAVSYVLVTSPKFPANDLAELIDVIKKNPGKFNYGSYGSGSGPHLSMVMLQGLAGIQAAHVQYSGSPQMLTALMAGEIEMAFDTPQSLMSHIQSGRLKAIAIAGPNPLEVIPGAAPIAKMFPGFDTDGWQGIFVPAGTPKGVVDKLAEEVAKALHSPEIESMSARLGVRLVGSTPEVFAAYMKNELRKYEQIVRENNIRVD